MLYQALKESSINRSATTISSGSGLLSSLFGFGASTSGVTVNNNSALTLSAFYNGITILCNDFAKLPKHVIQKTTDDRKPLPTHPVDYLINQKPNQYMNAFGFDSILMKCAILKGNGYAQKVINTFTGQVESLQYIDENKTPVTVTKYDNQLWYSFGGKTIPGEEMLHYRSLFSDNGITGIGIVTFAARSLGVSLESQEFATEYYKNKGLGLGVVTTSKPINDPDAKTRLATNISKALTEKAAKKFGVAVLDEMGSFQHVKITPQEALFLETNQNAIGEVARWLNIPVYKLKDTQNQNNSNMEHQSISHVSDSILPWALMHQQEYNAKLFTDAERKAGISVKFNINSLLQADKKTQADWYMKMIYSGVMTRNEVRVFEDLNRIDGLDEPLTPVNMQTLEQIQKQLNATENE